MYSRGARILDGAFMTQDLTFRATNSEAALTVSSVSIADPYVLLMMTDGSIQLLVGGTFIMATQQSFTIFNPLLFSYLQTRLHAQ